MDRFDGGPTFWETLYLLVRSLGISLTLWVLFVVVMAWLDGAF